MARDKMIYVSEKAHQRLKLLAARRKCTMGCLVEDLVERAIAELTDPWLSPEGLELQGRVLEDVWSDPALDVYEND